LARAPTGLFVAVPAYSAEPQGDGDVLGDDSGMYDELEEDGVLVDQDDISNVARSEVEFGDS